MQGIRWVALGLALFAIGLGVSIEMRVRALEGELIPKIIEGMNMQTLTNSWRCRNQTVTVATPRNVGETDAAFAAREAAGTWWRVRCR